MNPSVRPPLSPLSVVIASVNGFPYLARCLDALRDHCPEAEVVVADRTDETSRERVRTHWPEVHLLTFDEPMSVPELRAAGIAAASAPCVAVIEDHCRVTSGWGQRIVAAHRTGHRVVGGPVRNVATARVRDWAAFLCEYSAFLEPMAGGPVSGLTGMNVAYDREAIATMKPLLDEGRWESWLHPHLQRHGFTLHLEPEIVIEHDKDFGLREFLLQRWHYTRAFAAMRNPELGRRRVLYVAAAPLIVPLMFARIAGHVLRRRRHLREAALAVPLVLLYLMVGAAGEATGYALGGGGSLLEVR